MLIAVQVLAMLRRKDIELNIIGLSSRYIDACISYENGLHILRLTAVYETLMKSWDKMNYKAILDVRTSRLMPLERSSEYEEIIRKNWSVGGSVENSLEGCKLGLLRWSKHVFGSTTRSIEDIKNKLEFLSKKSKLHWCKNDDCNIAYFHAHANKKRVTNTIRGLKNRHGQWYEDVKDLETIIVDHFRALVSSTNPTSDCMDTVLDRVQIKVTNDMNK
ncbi:hypothetical protein ACH5RR_030214 [Cinchona calisaya]|uniref:Uncharacterized protein n=1 Tax=Cinchona calisaya TaxID=153742 RepID=A0ABD2YZ62_9GENT